LSAAQAKDFLGSFIEEAQVEILQETRLHLGELSSLLKVQRNSRGSIFHDIHTIVLMREHGIKRIATFDSHFNQFRDIEVLMPA
jgi:predicted nucleic acid-binding protein